MKQIFGINNYGCTCYINTTLQCLFNDVYFMKCLSRETPIQSALMTIFESKNPNISSFLKMLNQKFGKNMFIYSQNDMHEFFLLLLDLLENESKQSTKPFIGKTISKIKCSCANECCNKEKFICINIDIKSNTKSFVNAIDDYFKDNIPSWTCDKCNLTHKDIVKWSRVVRYPLTIPIVIKRFNAYGNKITHPIDFVETFYLHGSEKYELKSIGCHTGCSRSGHYYAYVKNKMDWFIVDDETIRQSNDIKKEDVYILFYTRCVI